jgi:hypothetical protein
MRVHSTEPQTASFSWRPLLPAIGIAFGLVLFRSFMFLRYEQLYFDADQAVTGLMAKHLAEGRAWPLFFYGQRYMLAVEAWLAAPFMAIGGATVFALRLPLLLLNALTASLLLGILVRDGRLTAGAAVLCTLFFTLAPPVPASRLIEAQGGNIEPFVYALLLWLLRGRPVAFGCVAAIGVLNREFTAYALVALAIVRGSAVLREWLTGLNLLALREPARHVAFGLAAFAVVYLGVPLLTPFADLLGPGSRGADLPPALGTVQAALGRLQFDPVEVPRNLRWLVTENLPALIGVTTAPTFAYMTTATNAAPRWLWWIWCGAGLLGMVRLAVLWRRGRRIPPVYPYLFLIALQAALVYAVLNLDVRAHVLIRYTLLGLLAPIALAGALLALESSRPIRAAVLTCLVLAGVVSLTQHLALMREYQRRRPPSPHRHLVEYLHERGVRYGYADYWTAYPVNFLSHETLVIGSREKVRVQEYQTEVERHDLEAVQIWREADFCAGEVRVGVWFICGP